VIDNSISIHFEKDATKLHLRSMKFLQSFISWYKNEKDGQKLEPNKAVKRKILNFNTNWLFMQASFYDVLTI